MNIEQERADFETWYKHHHGDRDVYALDEFGEYADKHVQGAFNVWQARATLQSQKPKCNDIMLSGVIRMPFEMAMADPISRMQFYQRAQQALNELEALQHSCKETSQDREDALRYRALVASGHFVPAPTPYSNIWGLRTTEGKATKAELDAAIDHARSLKEKEND